MQNKMLLFFACCMFSVPGQSQVTKYIVKLTDKGSSLFSLNNPTQYLSQRALDRRTRYNIALDSTDLPVTARYIDSLRLSGNVTILNTSKWLNQVAIQTSDATALSKINSFPFVAGTSLVAARLISNNPVNKKLDVTVTDNSLPVSAVARTTADFYDYGQSAGQVKIHQGDFLHNHGFRGEGMQLGVLDAGFYHYLSLPTFDSVRNNNQILGTWDFVNNEPGVDEDNYHGMQCLSTIAANLPGTFVGTAPKASFYLYRTEDVNSEYPIEEQNWAAGMERADSIGVDITSTSLGYYEFDDPSLNYSYADLDGNTTISARAADMAAKKGILVITAAGNEGNSPWHFLITPSDADSSLAVGAVNTQGEVAGFSSYGPSSDGQVKPGVAAVGLGAVVANTNTGQPGFSNGTSFACPNMAGISTCLWQAFPEINNMGIIEALEQSATHPATPDDRTGYGIPDVKKAFVMLQKKLYNGQAAIAGCDAVLEFNLKTDSSMQVVIERKTATESFYTTLSSLQNTGAYGMHHFSFTNDLVNVPQGPVTYRLKVNIATDTSFYLDSMAVTVTAACSNIISENSVVISQQRESAENVNIMITRTATARINIVVQNAAGQKIYSNQFQQAAGTQTKTLSIKDIAGSRGAYFLTVFIDNKKVMTKEILRP